jgi:hypothetical protein
MPKFTNEQTRKEDRRASELTKDKPKGMSILGAADRKKKKLRVDFHEYNELCKQERKIQMDKQKLKEGIVAHLKDEYVLLDKKYKGNDSLKNKKYRYTLDLLKDHSAVRAFYKKHLSQL